MESRFKTEVAEDRGLEIVCEPENGSCERAADLELEGTSAQSQSQDPQVTVTVPQATVTPVMAGIEAAAIVTASSIQASSNNPVSQESASKPLPHVGYPPVASGPDRGDSRAKQLFNALYFVVTGVAIAATINYLQLHIFWPVVAFLAVAGLLALRFTINNRAHPNDFEVNFSTATRRFIRAGALLVPIPFLVFALPRVPANWEFAEGMKLYDSANYAQAVPHFEAALRFNPQYAEAQEHLTYSYFYSDDFQKALVSANVALKAFPDSSPLLAEKAYVLNQNGSYQEALPIAQRATQLDATNGQAFADLAESNYRLGHFTAALEAANIHARLHSDEAEAFRSRQSINQSLGNDAAAAQDGATAARLEGSDTSPATDTGTDSGTAADTSDK